MDGSIITARERYPRITVDPLQCAGVPCVRHLRIPVATVVDLVAAGLTVDEILSDYPDLTRDDVLEALMFTVSERNVAVPITPLNDDTTFELVAARG